MTPDVAVRTTAIVASFLAGSIPFGLLVGLVFYKTDLRKHGSGNIGAANAMRTIGRAGAVATLLLDLLKGLIPVALATRAADPQFTFAVAVAAITGHCFSPFLSGKGGKGVATALGALIALHWPTALIAVALYAIAVKVLKISAVGSLLMALTMPVGLTVAYHTPGTLYGTFVALLLIYTHRTNIRRLIDRQENTLTQTTIKP